MKKKMNCEQISALITFYLNGTLSPTLTKYVQKHLEYCNSCQEKYCREIINVADIIPEENYLTKQYEIFKTNLSAYIDNELNDNDNIKIKKIAISNPQARQDLEEIYLFKKMLHSAYEKTKNEMKTDYSKSIISKLHYKKSNITFYKIAVLFALMISSIVFGLVKILYL